MALDANLRMQQVKKSYSRMFFFGVAVAMLALVAAWVCNALCPWTSNWIKGLEYAGYVCWSATLGTVGWEAQTYSGKSPAEILDQTLAKIFSLLGIFFFVI